MSFLYCDPNVLIVKNCYEILVNTLSEGVCYVQIGRKIYHENNSGIMPSKTLVHKFRIPQKALDKAKKYKIVYKKVEERKSYFPIVAEPECVEYKFKPIEKEDNINLFYIADIHTNWDKALGCSTYFGDDLDMYIVNGDFGESSSYENLKDLNKLIGNVTKGEIPTLVGRGNHDTRGLLAEKVTDYMATEDGHAYFDFTVGPISGVIFDCGEDKYDNHPEYNSLNFFEQYRRDELKYMKKVKLADKPFKFAVCHVPFMSSYCMKGTFDIMPDLYAKWGEVVEKMGIEFMICGHDHWHAFIDSKNESNKFPHSYPVVVGSALNKEHLSGTAVTLKKSGTTMMFVNDEKNVCKEFDLITGFENEVQWIH